MTLAERKGWKKCLHMEPSVESVNVHWNYKIDYTALQRQKANIHCPPIATCLSLHLPIMMSNLLTRPLNFLSHSRCAFELKKIQILSLPKVSMFDRKLKFFWKNFSYKLRAKVHKFRVRHDHARQTMALWERRITGLNEKGNINYTHCIVFVCFFVYANWDVSKKPYKYKTCRIASPICSCYIYIIKCMSLTTRKTT